MKVLIVKMSSLGDMVHLLPALTDAAKARPDCEFHWISEENFTEIPGWHPAIKKVITIALRRWRKKLLASIKSGEVGNFLKELRKENYDLIIDGQGLLKSAVIGLCARGKVRVGYNFSCAREPLASFFYQRKLPIKKDQHAILRLRKLFAEALHYNFDETKIDFGIRPSPLQSTESSSKDIIFLHGTTRTYKYWPVDRWIELAKAMGKKGYRIQLTWGNTEEKERAEYIASQAQPYCNILNKTTLTQVRQILSNAKAAIAVDTGLGHLAAALDIPVISLYGRTIPKLIGATGKNSHHLAAKSGCRDFVDVSVKEVEQLLNSLIA